MKLLIGLILIILLFGCTAPKPNPEIGAVEAIGNKLQDGRPVPPTTQEFFMSPYSSVSGSDFEHLGFESKSIVFNEGDYEDRFFVTFDENGSTLHSNTDVFDTFRADVYCEATGDRLRLALDMDEVVVEEKLCLADAEIQPCCAIVLKRPHN